MTDQHLRFDLAGLARICVILLSVMVVADILFALDSYGMLQFLDAVEAGTMAEAELNAWAERVDAQAVFVGFGYLAIFIACAVFSSVWIYRASWNARQLQPDADRITPGWAVGWYFIPILSLWKPYQAMAQTWNSSHNPGGDLKASMPGFVLMWWILWVVISLAGNLSFRWTMRAETVEDFRAIANLDLLTAPFAVITAVLFLWLIKSITAAQCDKRPAVEIADTKLAREPFDDQL